MTCWGDEDDNTAAFLETCLTTWLRYVKIWGTAPWDKQNGRSCSLDTVDEGVEACRMQ